MGVTVADDPERWNSFLREQAGPIFSRWEWGTLCESYGHDRVFLRHARDGETRGVLPMIRCQSPIFGNKLVSMPFSEYGGPTARAGGDAVAELYAEAIELAEEASSDYLLVRGIDPERVPDALETEQRYVAFEVPLRRGPDALWDSFESRLRRAIRKARKSDVEITTATGPRDLEQYYDLFLETMRGHGTPPHSYAFFEELSALLGEDGRVRVYLAKADGRPINGAVILRGQDRAHYWNGVSNIEYRDLNGGSLILWTAIEDLAAAGYDVLDLGRTRPGTGVYKYKRGFNGDEVPLMDAYYFSGKSQTAPDPHDDEYDLARRLWRRLPLALTKYVGPYIRRHFP